MGGGGWSKGFSGGLVFGEIQALLNARIWGIKNEYGSLSREPLPKAEPTFRFPGHPLVRGVDSGENLHPLLHFRFPKLRRHQQLQDRQRLLQAVDYIAPLLKFVRRSLWVEANSLKALRHMSPDTGNGRVDLRMDTVRLADEGSGVVPRA